MRKPQGRKESNKVLSGAGVLADGLVTGLLLQIAVGPVFFFIVNMAMQRGFRAGLAAVAAVTMVDYIYIALSIAGLGQLLERRRLKRIAGVVGALALAAFGCSMVYGALRGGGSGPGAVDAAPDYLSSFLSAFILTASSPLTIVFWTGLFATKAAEKDYDRSQLLLFGLAAGSATFIFLGLSVLGFSIARTAVPPVAVRILNGAVGVVLCVYGTARLIRGSGDGGAGSPEGRGDPTE